MDVFSMNWKHWYEGQGQSFRLGYHQPIDGHWSYGDCQINQGENILTYRVRKDGLAKTANCLPQHAFCFSLLIES